MTGSNPEFLRKFSLRPLSMRVFLCDKEVKTEWWSISAAELVKDQCNGVMSCLISVSTIYVPENSLPCPRPVSRVLYTLVKLLSVIRRARVSPGTVLPTGVQSHGLLSRITPLSLTWHHFLLNGVSVLQSSSAASGLTSKNCIWAPK